MKNKFLTISIIFLLISFIFINSNVFASNNTSTYIGTDDKEYIIPADISNFIIAEMYGSDHYILMYSTDLTTTWKITQLNDTYKTTSIINSSGSFNYIKITKGNTDFSAGTVETRNGDYTVYQDIIYSSIDIYDIAGTGIFFQQTPPTIIPETVEIPAVETVEQIPTAMVETLKMIIPVGLVVLSVVLLIYLTRRLICRCS